MKEEIWKQMEKKKPIHKQFDSLTDLIELKINIWSVDTVIRVNMFAVQMSNCLEYLQSHKMGHFDIKPEKCST